MEEPKVYIVLTDTGTLFTRLIKRYTKKPYNHASVAFDKELKEVYSFGRKRLHNPFIGGFVTENMRSGLFKQADAAVYALSVSKADIYKMKHYINNIETEKDAYHYNLIGLLGVPFNTPIKRKKAFFCSQFTANVLQHSEQIVFVKDAALMTPHDLTDIADLNLVYEGKLNLYVMQNEITEVRFSLQNMVEWS